jgi:putative membrane protein insertion efficiency factor
MYGKKMLNMVMDREYPNEPRLKELDFNLSTFPRLLIMAVIRLYQMTLSKALPGNTCRFYPSCSHYGYQAIYKYGVLKGSILAIKRILRCNPFNPGDYDPVP